jgi:hypothetical protein
VPTIDFSIKSEVSAADSHVLELDLQSSGGYDTLREVELVPEVGAVSKLKMPDRSVLPGQPLVFLIPRNHLRPNTDFRVMLTLSDSAFGASCVILARTIVGTIPKTTIAQLGSPPW